MYKTTSIKNLIWIKSNIKEIVTIIIESKSGLVIRVKEKNVKDVMYFLKHNTHCQYNSLSDITAVDYISKIERYEINYHLLSTRFNQRICVKVNLEPNKVISSITKVYKAANWYEREIYDIFGIFFKGHPDLRRILTDYGFEGHPLRKNYPLTGYIEVKYSVKKKRIVNTPRELSKISEKP